MSSDNILELSVIDGSLNDPGQFTGPFSDPHNSTPKKKPMKLRHLNKSHLMNVESTIYINLQLINTEHLSIILNTTIAIMFIYM